MHPITVTDVRALPGDAAFLIDDGKTAVLCDTGFAFTGDRVAENIKNVLGDRPLDFILLTHSHYDHALGSAYIRKHFPGVQVAAGQYAVKIFQKPTARAVMRDLDRKFAARCGVTDYEDRIDELQVDIAVADGDTLRAGDMTFTAIDLPGHTRCSMGFYLAENRLLLGCETLGVYDGEDTVVPCYLIGYQTALDSIARAEAMAIDNILVPHYGLLDGPRTASYLAAAGQTARETAQHIAAMLRAGQSKQAAVDWYIGKYYRGNVTATYPPDAIRLNTGIMVNLIEKEMLG